MISLASQFVSMLKFPGAGNMYDVYLVTKVLREWCIGCCEAHNTNCSIIEGLVTRTAPDVDVIQLTIRQDGDVQYQAAGKVAALGLFRVIQVADALDLGTPCIHIGSEFVFTCVGGKEFLSRPFLVVFLL